MSATTTRPVDDPRSEYGSAPERSLAQRFAALELANATRTKRSQLKRDLKARRVRVDALLISPPVWLETMKVFDVLIATPRIGRRKASVMLEEAKVSPSKTVGGLSSRQRAELVALVREPTHPTMRRCRSCGR